MLGQILTFFFHRDGYPVVPVPFMKNETQYQKAFPLLLQCHLFNNTCPSMHGLSLGLYLVTLLCLSLLYLLSSVIRVIVLQSKSSYSCSFSRIPSLVFCISVCILEPPYQPTLSPPQTNQIKPPAKLQNLFGFLTGEK